MKVIYLFFKRFFDILASFLALVLLALPFIVIAVIIKCSSKGPVFFKQKRVGKNKKLFTILKFRTMRTDAPKDTATHLLGNADSYITGVGKFLRKTSIDELPQIFNIFAGHMSVVGPRPALYNQYDLIELRDKYGANGVRPGLTGLAQVSGRDELELDVKARLDGEYVSRMSLWLDIKIFFKTVFSVFRHDGVVEGGTGALHSDLTDKTEESTESAESGNLAHDDAVTAFEACDTNDTVDVISSLTDNCCTENFGVSQCNGPEDIIDNEKNNSFDDGVSSEEEEEIV